MNQIKNTLNFFNKVSLSDLDQVSLMNRTDRKYCLHITNLPSVLEAILDNYSILSIDGETIFDYDNTYFDTSDDQMFLNHQNGKLNRTKVRIRKYVQTNDNFLEIKRKTNKGRTIKERVERQNSEPTFTHDELNFIQNYTCYSSQQLIPRIRNYFNRFTLVNKEFTERVTVDFTLRFENRSNSLVLNNLVFIEIKQSRAGHAGQIDHSAPFAILVP